MENNNMNKVETLKNLILPAVRANRIAKVTFRKKDGSLREMQLHRSRALEDTVADAPSASVEKRKWTLSQNGMMAVEELTKDGVHQFRTINLNTVERLAVGGQVYDFTGAVA